MIRVSQPVTGQAELDAISGAMEEAYFGHGAKVVEFEQAIKSFLGDSSYHVACVNSGTAALHLALDAVGIGPGDEVLLPSITFVASFQAVLAVGATPVACDVQEKDLLLDLEDAARRVTPQSKAIMPVHYVGNPGELEDIYAFARQHGLKVVEDAAHAFGGTYQGRKIGVTGETACFSFDSLKNITCGEGGAVVCRDPEVAGQVRLKRALGMERGSTPPGGVPGASPYDVVSMGWRYHMSNLNACIGLAQLAKAPEFIARRQEIARRYDESLAGLAGLATLEVDYQRVVPYIYTIRVLGGRRAGLAEYLRAHDVETGIFYPPIHLFSHFQVEGLNLPVSERVGAEMLTIPMHCGLSDDQVARIVDLIRDFKG